MKGIWSRLFPKPPGGHQPTGESLSSVVLRGHSVGVNAVAFSPNGDILASGSGSRYDQGDDSIRLWSVENQREVAMFRQRSAGVESIAFTPDGAVIAAGLTDHSVVLHSIRDREVVARLPGHLLTPRVAFSPDGTLLAAAAHAYVTLWAPFEEEEVAILKGHEWYVSCVAFSPDGRFIASGGDQDDSTIVWELPDRPVHRLSVRAFSLAFSPDGEELACGCADGQIEIWRLGRKRSGLKRRSNRISLSGHERHVGAIAYSSDGCWLATGSYDNSIKLWRLPDYEEVFLLQGHTGSVWGLDFSPDSKLLGSASEDETIRLWTLPAD